MERWVTPPRRVTSPTWGPHLHEGPYDIIFMMECDDKIRSLRACLHGGGGPQIGEVTRLGGVTHLSI